MTIANYSELRAAIQDWLKRSDCLNKLDTFIGLAEVDIWSALRVREMEARATASTSTSTRFVELPPGFIKMRQLMLTVSGVQRDIDFVPLKNMALLETTGTPYRFSVTTQIEFNRVPDQAYAIEMDYFRSLAPLTASNADNDVLTSYPMIYLAGCLGHAFRWAMMPDDAEYWQAQFNKSVAQANRKSRNGRHGPAPSSMIHGGMVV